MSGHTKLPWAISTVSADIIVNNRDNFVAKCGESLFIPENEQDANAAFIVRAVNAHDELVAELRNMIDIYWGEHGDGGQEPTYIVRAKAALAKAQPQTAEGEK
jgi:hypothetical protein